MFLTSPSFAQASVWTQASLGYYIGIAGGLTLMIAAAIWLVYYLTKSYVYRKLVRRVGLVAQKAIADDIKLWARHTSNKYIESALVKNEQDEWIQIDGILLTSQALVVVKVKSLRGMIRGEADQPTWKRNYQGKTELVTNAVLENDLHIKLLQPFLPTKLATLSLVIYSNKTALVEIANLPSHVIVTRHVDLFAVLDQISAKLPVSLSNKVKKQTARVLKNNLSFRARDKIVYERLAQASKD
ncbi:nuclease-related domain-containing protein [Mycoplasma sp. ATU-Cv-703]|uniref:NERD domain-containing protein n=1 Tax=Mycoplasma sp. ATU-Cv-703 TaxID=2498595 RepID=UPI000FDD7642